MLGFELRAVDVARDAVEVLAEPAPDRPRLDASRRDRLLKDHAGCVGNPSPGGSTRRPVKTARRQRALACAVRGARPAVATCGRSPDAAVILVRDVYGWSERSGRGVDRLTEAGEAALRRWTDPDATAG